jgi:hypothetical protein
MLFALYDIDALYYLLATSICYLLVLGLRLQLLSNADHELSKANTYRRPHNTPPP